MSTTIDKMEELDEPIICGFCCKSFNSIEEIQIHDETVHNSDDNKNNSNSINESEEVDSNKKEETDSSLNDNLDGYSVINFNDFLPMIGATSKKVKTNNPTNEKVIESQRGLDNVTIYNSAMQPIPADKVDRVQVAYCHECKQHFLDDDHLRNHQYISHKIRKRKRQSNPNEVTGILVTGDGRFSCNICGKMFPVMKQAKVHKFKSHDEPDRKLHALNLSQYSYSTTEIVSKNSNHVQERPKIPLLPNIKSEPSVSYEQPLPRVEPIQMHPISNASSIVSPKLIITENEDATHQNLEKQEITVAKSWQVKDDTNSTNDVLKLSFVRKIESKLPVNTPPEYVFNYPSNVLHSRQLPARPFHCPFCPLEFDKNLNYTRHLIISHRGQPNVCDVCLMRFTRLTSLHEHKKSNCAIKSDETIIAGECAKCHLKFANKRSLLSHVGKVCKSSIVAAEIIPKQEILDSRTTESTEICGSSSSLPEDSTDGNFSPVDDKSEVTTPLVDDRLMDNEDDDLDSKNLEDKEEIDINRPLSINDFVNNPIFVYRFENNFTCNLCNFTYKTAEKIGLHLEDYHRIEVNPKPKHDGQANNNNNIVISNVQYNKSHMMNDQQKFIEIMSRPIVAQQTYQQPINLTSNISGSNAGVRRSYSAMSTTHHNRSSVSSNGSNAKRTKIQPNYKGEFECEKCNKSFGCRSSLSNHIKSHFTPTNRPFTCIDCKAGFMSPKNLEDHRSKRCTKLFGEDDIAKMKAAEVSNGNGSAKISSGNNRSAVCVHCSAEFSDKSMLEDHAANEHSNENGDVICHKCTRTFPTYMAFRVHMTKTHGGPNNTPLKKFREESSMIDKLKKINPSNNSVSPIVPRPTYSNGTDLNLTIPNFSNHNSLNVTSNNVQSFDSNAFMNTLTSFMSQLPVQLNRK